MAGQKDFGAAAGGPLAWNESSQDVFNEGQVEVGATAHFVVPNLAADAAFVVSNLV